jgi:ATP-dependent metalloprotease
MLRGAVLSSRSSWPALRVSLRVVCASSRRPPARLPPVQSARPFSLASLFGRPNPKSIPSPQVVALITRLEADANVSPHDVDKQLALFRALVDTRMPSSYELVVTRWDRMCEFVRLLLFILFFHPHTPQDASSPLLHSADAFQLYLGCLVNLGQENVVNIAVEKRDTLMAAHPLPAASSPEVTPETTDSAPQTEPPASQQPKETQSQILAQTVLARRTAPPSTGTMSQADLSKFLASLSGESGSPIQVSIIERSYTCGRHCVEI